MNIVFFAHPSFLVSQSMPRFAKMLSDGMGERGHTVEIWSPVSQLNNYKIPPSVKKWFGYFIQFILFPIEVQKRLRKCGSNTLFVITDNALGPWVPLVAKRPHIIHCHDFLAQRSALGQISENPISWTGKTYQAFIRRGYSQGRNFVSVSEKTRQDLHHLLPSLPAFSEVLYTGLNKTFTAYPVDKARTLFGKSVGLDLELGYLLHVGGNQWYKNRGGLIAIYNALRSTSSYTLPLILVGAAPSAKLQNSRDSSPYAADIIFLTGISDESVQLAYAGASLLVFPSLAEGFGWPIAEAMVAGCPVVTTGEAPMTEVAGEAAYFIPRQPENLADRKAWANEAAEIIKTVLDLPQEERKKVVEKGIINAQRFNAHSYLNEVEALYKRIIANYE
ncbi:hypothetical protein GCM10027299_41580 [Larkinella ripae]